MESERFLSVQQESLPFRVGEMVRPETTADIGELLAAATESGRTVVPIGGAVSIATGNSVDAFDIGLDTTALGGILSWEPADLVLSVRAGATFDEVQAELATHNQAIPIDVAYPERATIGGIVATGYAGPRRLRTGSLRDLLIGCEYVRGDGLIANAGGMVVKNVSGFEIPRFLHGSWGSLAVITSLNLKVTPRPRSDGTLIHSTSDVDDALRAAQAVIAKHSSAGACTVTIDPDGVTVAVRAQGREGAVTETLRDVSSMLGGGDIVRDDESAAWWQAHLNRFGEVGEGSLIALSTRPRAVADLVRKLVTSPEVDGGAAFAVDPGLGSVRVRLTGPGSGHLAPLIDVATGAGATWVVERLGPGVELAMSPWGPVPDGLALMRSVKKEFDPAGILNRGRLVV